VVDPTNPQHLISSSNDYGSCCDEYYTTFNAGATWSTGNMSVEDSSRTGSDPVTSFDVKHHVALPSSLNYTFNDGGRDLRRRRGRLTLAEDGSRDYPINDDGRQTLTGYQVRVNSAGNIAVDASGKVYLVFDDNRNGVHDSANPVTNIDTFVTSSSNGGTTWTSPARVDTGAGDQWFPWIDVNPLNGRIGILYHDRGASNGPTYNTARRRRAPDRWSRRCSARPRRTRRCRSSSRPGSPAASSVRSSTATTSDSPKAATATRTQPGRTCASRLRSRPACSCSSSTTHAGKA
jgi:hypothetical protein